MDVLSVGALMTANPIAVAPDTEFREIAALLTRERISAVPVVDRRGALVGVVSEADLLHKEALSDHTAHSREVRRYRRKAAALRAAELMTSPVRTVDIDTPMPAAARALADGAVRRLFVLDQGKLVGVLSRRDVLDVFLRPDADVREEIDNEVFQRVLGATPGTYSITVDNGVVTLLGLLERKSTVTSAGRLTELVAGVLGVRNRLDFVWIDE
ncbi:MAG TPA: CBS domain-containing protein [Amycolatopsis sp.]|uniref:CBS domain-containing protein n=1 Tax=Amycolatopsis sp. TaxID=37632 RepID=UPI002B47C403|nr:CBS domain-containing protein [Amycolatopsis sp.]HKS44970.1 CBS domain-containing protein [Amycolatopsis sp.]